MDEYKVRIHSHHFVAFPTTERVREALRGFSRSFIKYAFERRPGGRYERVPKTVFAASTKDRHEFRFHINTLSSFKRAMTEKGLIQQAEFEVVPSYEPARAELILKPGWFPQDHQASIIDFIANDGEPISKFVALQTGRGKSFCSMAAAVRRGYRMVVFIRPMYIDKWIIDFQKTLELKDGDLVTVRGIGQLQDLIHLSMNDPEFNPSIIIISNKTMQMWINAYEEFKNDTLLMGYGCLPHQLHEVLRVGERLSDEVHQDFHLNFKIDLYSHVPHSTSLSATLIPDDEFLARMCQIQYPELTRCPVPEYNKFIMAKAILYRFRHPNKLRYKQPGMGSYSHVVFEQTLMRKEFLEARMNYFAAIEKLIRSDYLTDEYKSGDKCAVYCATKDFCALLRDYLIERFPDKDVRRYVDEDPYENLMEAEITVTTLNSAGTAVDIPDLTTVILTVAIRSSQGNVQGFGRLRELKDGRTPRFIYLVCEDIRKHLEYHQLKKVLLESRAKYYKIEMLPGPL